MLDHEIGNALRHMYPLLILVPACRRLIKTRIHDLFVLSIRRESMLMASAVMRAGVVYRDFRKPAL